MPRAFVTSLTISADGFLSGFTLDYLNSTDVPPGPAGPPGIDGEDGQPGPPGRDGQPGATGATGAPGSPGTPGAAGAKWFSGSGAPTNPPSLIGAVDGDYYLNGQNGWVYTASAGTWVFVTNLTGPQGPVGMPGIPGQDGEDGIPGPKGDTGAAGAAGTPGTPGATGAAGVMGPPGFDGGDDSAWVPMGLTTLQKHNLPGAVVNFLVPTGTVVDYAGVQPPLGWLQCDGSAIDRNTYTDLWAAIAPVVTGNTTNGSAIVTSISGGTSTIRVGAPVEGTGIPAGATVLSVDSSSQVTLSAAATVTATPNTLQFYPFGNGNGTSTFNLPDFRRRVAVGFGGTGTATLPSALGSTGGEESHTLTVAEMPAHTHPDGNVRVPTVGGGTLMNLTVGGGAFNYNAAVPTQGGGSAHNNLPPSLVTLKIIKT